MCILVVVNTFPWFQDNVEFTFRISVTSSINLLRVLKLKIKINLFKRSRTKAQYTGVQTQYFRTTIPTLSWLRYPADKATLPLAEWDLSRVSRSYPGWLRDLFSIRFHAHKRSPEPTLGHQNVTGRENAQSFRGSKQGFSDIRFNFFWLSSETDTVTVIWENRVLTSV